MPDLFEAENLKYFLQWQGELRFAQWTVRYRAPSSADLVAAFGGRSPEEARQLLGERCIVEARREDVVGPTRRQ